MPGGNKKQGHTYLNRPAAESCRFVQVCVTFLLPPGIKGLSFNYTAMARLNQLKSEIKAEWHSFNFISLEKNFMLNC